MPYNFGIGSIYLCKLRTSSIKKEIESLQKILCTVLYNILLFPFNKLAEKLASVDQELTVVWWNFLKPSKDILLRGIRQKVSAKAVWPLENVDDDVAHLSEVERQLHTSYSWSKLLINIYSEQKLDNSSPKKGGNSITALSNTKNSVEINSNDLYI